MQQELADNEHIKQFAKHDDLMQKEIQQGNSVPRGDEITEHYAKADEHAAIAAQHGKESGLFGPGVHDMEDYHMKRFNTIAAGKDYEAGHATPDGKYK